MLARINWRGDGRSQLITVRRDTFELENVESVSFQCLDKLQDAASSSLKMRRKPHDWGAPHRRCIAYFLKMRRKRDEIFPLLQQPQSDSKGIIKVLYRNEAYALYLSRKVNSLSERDKGELLIPSRGELLPDRSTSLLDILYARAALYWWMFSRSSSIDQAYENLLRLIDRGESEGGSGLGSSNST